MLNITFILALMNNKTLYFIKNLVNITNKNIPTAKKYNLYYDNIHEIRKEMYEGGKFILIQLNKNIIGYVKYTIKNKNCYLNSFSIHPYYFSKQIENIVFNFLNDVAVNYNCDKILIEIPISVKTIGSTKNFILNPDIRNIVIIINAIMNAVLKSG